MPIRPAPAPLRQIAEVGEHRSKPLSAGRTFVPSTSVVALQEEACTGGDRGPADPPAAQLRIGHGRPNEREQISSVASQFAVIGLLEVIPSSPARDPRRVGSSSTPCTDDSSPRQTGRHRSASAAKSRCDAVDVVWSAIDASVVQHERLDVGGIVLGQLLRRGFPRPGQSRTHRGLSRSSRSSILSSGPSTGAIDEFVGDGLHDPADMRTAGRRSGRRSLGPGRQ